MWASGRASCDVQQRAAAFQHEGRGRKVRDGRDYLARSARIGETLVHQSVQVARDRQQEVRDLKRGFQVERSRPPDPFGIVKN